jgi:hypothetical protein
MRKVFFALPLFALSAYAADAPPVSSPPVIGATLGAQEVLTKLTGKRAMVTTRSGKEYDGAIAEVSKTAVVVQGLAGGKDFYTAWVRVDDIEAITYKTK